MRIVICTPVYSETTARFSQSLFRLGVQSVISSLGNMRPELEIDSFVHSAPNIGHCRRLLAHEAIEAGAHWTLWIDADHSFPHDGLFRLLRSGKEIIGANYRHRNPYAVMPTAIGQDGKPVEPKPNGIEEVQRLGLGFCLISTAVFRAIERPWFAEQIRPDGNPVPEDAYFFDKARAAGFIPFVDHALSNEVGHIAETVLRF